MSVGERDPHSGHMTTGHEWNGIKELNTPVPRLIWLFGIVFLLFSVVYWVLMPAWPLGKTYTKGLLGTDQQKSVAEKIKKASAERSVWTGKIATMGYADILADKALMTIVREDGRRLFSDNCAACHGHDATGSKGFPNLVDKDWLWSGDPEAVAQTINVGINNAHKGARVSQMMAFGRDKMLEPDAVMNVAQYVLSLSHPALAKGESAVAIKAGREVFAANCAACHGVDGRSKRTPGAPNLTDKTWLYGGDLDSVHTSIFEGRQGEMPAWEERLGPVDRKILTLYVLDRGASHK